MKTRIIIKDNEHDKRNKPNLDGIIRDATEKVSPSRDLMGTEDSMPNSR